MGTILSESGNSDGWHAVLIENERDTAALSQVQREIKQTASAMLGHIVDRVDTVLNYEGVWACDIKREGNERVMTLHYSTRTLDTNGNFRPCTRREAMCMVIHECMHKLMSTWVDRPEWCERAHWGSLFGVLNMSEDVRIEDAAEDLVPVFPTLRVEENERLMRTNFPPWGDFDFVRKVALGLFARRCCSASTSHKVDTLIANDSTELLRIVNEQHDEWDRACSEAASTKELLQRLRPLYEALKPLFNINEPPPPPPGEGGDEGEQPGNGGEQPGNGGEQPGNGGEQPGDGGEQPGDGGEQPGNGGEQESGESTFSNEGGEQGEDNGEAGTSGGRGSGGGNLKQPLASTIPEEHMVPQGRRDDWYDYDKEPPPSYRDTDYIKDVMNGAFVDPCDSDTDDDYAPPPQYPDAVGNDMGAVAATGRRVRKVLARVLQHNADGSYVGKRRRGAFDSNASTRLALGDVRVFRTKQGPRGSRDFSLVLCLDASSSVRGECGINIIKSGIAVIQACDRTHGIDATMCAYGGRGLMSGMPFGHDERDRERVIVRTAWDVANGNGGGTDETSALVWAHEVSKRRNAEKPLVIVMTDGYPNNAISCRKAVDAMRADGIVTGGLGIMMEAPAYHEYSASAMTYDQMPTALMDMLRDMMKAR